MNDVKIDLFLDEIIYDVIVSEEPVYKFKLDLEQVCEMLDIDDEIVETDYGSYMDMEKVEQHLSLFHDYILEPSAEIWNYHYIKDYTIYYDCDVIDKVEFELHEHMIDEERGKQ